MHIFHGGCHGCIQQMQRREGVLYCVGCQYFDADWSLPDLSFDPHKEAEKQFKNKIRQMAKNAISGEIMAVNNYM